MEVVDEICRVMTRHRVVPVPPRDILRVEGLSTTWRCLPCDMMMLMHHIFGVINLIHTLRDGAHDPTTSSSSAKSSTSFAPPHGPPSSPDSPPHESIATSIDHPSTYDDPPPLVFLAHVYEPVSMSDPPPPPLPSLMSPSIDHCLSPSPHVS